jgi:hypothetical protein
MIRVLFILFSDNWFGSFFYEAESCGVEYFCVLDIASELVRRLGELR